MAQQIAQLLGLGAAFGQRIANVDGADVLVDQLTQGTAVAGPVARRIGRAQAHTHVAEFAVQAGDAFGEGEQQCLRMRGMRKQPYQQCGGGGGIVCAGLGLGRYQLMRGQALAAALAVDHGVHSRGRARSVRAAPGQQAAQPATWTAWGFGLVCHAPGSRKVFC